MFQGYLKEHTSDNMACKYFVRIRVDWRSPVIIQLETSTHDESDYSETADLQTGRSTCLAKSKVFMK